jgi:hypothetical protein
VTNKKRLCSLAVVALLSGCATTGDRAATAALFAQAVPICTILAHPDAYVGKRVLVRGHSETGPHGRDFWDGGCERGFLPIELHWPIAGERLLVRLDRYALQAERQPSEIPVVYSGMLTDFRPGFSCHLICQSFALKDARIEAVRRP